MYFFNIYFLKTDQMTVSQRFKMLRTEKKLSQTEFGERLGVKQDVISRIENGEYKYVATQIMEILHIEFKVNINWLLTGKGDVYVNDSKELTHDAKAMCEKLEKENKELKDKVHEYQDIIINTIVKSKPNAIEELTYELRQVKEELAKYKTKENEASN